MLLHRVITAFVLIVLALLVLFVFPSFVYVWVSSLVLLYGAWEWAGFMKLPSFMKKMGYVVLVCVLGVLLGLHKVWAFPLCLLALVWWLWHFLLILAYPRATKLWSPVWVKAISGLFVLLPCWFSVNAIYAISPSLMLILFLIIWGSDTTAYFSGRFWGKRKLLPAVSPGKTWAGFWGASATSAILAIVCMFTVSQFHRNPIYAFILFIVTMLFSVLGDLVESMYKRDAGLKDSGNIFPGHGGLLDRIDSLTSAAPLFFMGLMFNFF